MMVLAMNGVDIPLLQLVTDKESTQHAAIFKQHSIDIMKVGADITISDHSDQHNWHIVTSPPFKKDKIR